VGIFVFLPRIKIDVELYINLDWVFCYYWTQISYIKSKVFTLSDKNSIWVQIIQIYYLVCSNKILSKISSLYISGILPADPDLAELQFLSEALQIIAQPCYPPKLRYLPDYQKNKKRLGVLRSRNNPNYKSPAIRVNLYNYSSTFPIKNKSFIISRFHKHILIIHNNITFVFLLLQWKMRKQNVVIFIHMNLKILMLTVVMTQILMLFDFAFKEETPMKLKGIQSIQKYRYILWI